MPRPLLDSQCAGLVVANGSPTLHNDQKIMSQLSHHPWRCPKRLPGLRSFWVRMTPASSRESNCSPMVAERESNARPGDVHDCSQWAVFAEHKEACHV